MQNPCMADCSSSAHQRCSCNREFCQVHMHYHLQHNKSHGSIFAFNTYRKWCRIMVDKILKVKKQVNKDKQKVVRSISLMMREIEAYGLQVIKALDWVSYWLNPLAEKLNEGNRIDINPNYLQKWLLNFGEQKVPYKFGIHQVSFAEHLQKAINWKFKDLTQPSTSQNQSQYIHRNENQMLSQSMNLNPNFENSLINLNMHTKFNINSSLQALINQSLLKSYSPNNSLDLVSINYNSKPQDTLHTRVPVRGTVENCPNGHQFKWNNLAHFQHYQKTQEFLIPCAICKKTISDSCWTCECGLNMCDGCGKSPPILKCNQGHKLNWRSDIMVYYKKKYKGGSKRIRCDVCKTVCFYHPSPHCRTCEFDICSYCISLTFYKVPSARNFCPFDHKMFLHNQRMAVAQCSLCKKWYDGQTHLICQQGQFQLCPSCLQNPSFLHYAGHPGIRCFNNHLLIWSPAQNFSCNICCQQKLQSRFRCNIQDFDICALCTDRIVSLLTKYLCKLKCPQSHSIKLQIVNNNINKYQCKNCKKFLTNPYKFSCTICSITICLNCIFLKTNT